MEIKKGLDVHTGDFWYDLTDGGYLKPKEICKNECDALRVIEAAKVVLDFQTSCEEQILGFYQ